MSKNNIKEFFEEGKIDKSYEYAYVGKLKEGKCCICEKTKHIAAGIITADGKIKKMFCEECFFYAIIPNVIYFINETKNTDLKKTLISKVLQ